MKNPTFILLLFMLFGSCSTQTPIKQDENVLSFDKNEEDEYDIMVLDTQYDMYLKSIARPMNYYSESYYKNKNQFYVMEWNSRYMNPMQYGDFYSVRIDYDPRTNYGITLEYKLYNYFQFIKWKYNVNLDFGR